MRITKLICFLLILTMLSALYGQAQECGVGFSTIKVSNSKDKKIRGVIIEIVAELPKEGYKMGYGKFNKMSVLDAEAVIKQNLPMRYDKDHCGNPLRQYAGITKVKKIYEQKPNIQNFGFCTGEVYQAALLLKISAPGHLTDYYIGNYLGGCYRTYDFVLTKKKKLKISKRRNLQKISHPKMQKTQINTF